MYQQLLVPETLQAFPGARTHTHTHTQTSHLTTPKYINMVIEAREPPVKPHVFSSHITYSRHASTHTHTWRHMLKFMNKHK